MSGIAGDCRAVSRTCTSGTPDAIIEVRSFPQNLAAKEPAQVAPSLQVDKKRKTTFGEWVESLVTEDKSACLQRQIVVSKVSDPWCAL